MYFMYVDESGDTGINNSTSTYFALTGVVVHELRWKEYLDQMITFRKMLKNKYGLFMREEIHAGKFITRPGSLVRIKRNDRLSILRAFTNEISSMSDLNIINILVDKRNKNATYDVFGNSWTALIQRFENTISRRNFRGPANPDERGLIIPDDTDQNKLINLTRKMRRYNPIPNMGTLGYRNISIRNIVEDPFFKNSETSYFIQMADLSAYLLYQYHSPNGYMKNKGGNKYFLKLDPVLCKVASTGNSQGIVYL